MSFVQRLRMANMFPVNSDLGNADINLGNSDPMGDVIEAGKRLYEWRMQHEQPNGLQRVAQQSGGMQPSSSLPGYGDFSQQMNRPTNFRVENAQATPLPPMEEGIRPGAENNIVNKDASGENDIDKNLARATKISAIENANKRTDIAEQNAGKSKKRVVAITDPNDSTKQINAFYDEDTGQVTPMKMGGADTIQPGASAKTNLAEQEKDKKEAKSEDLIKNHAKDALAILDTLSKATGKVDENGYSIEELNPNTQNIIGASGNIPAFIADTWDPKNATARAAIEQLASMLSLSKMQELRAQSKTGTTGFGSNMNQKEFSTLINAASTLSKMTQDEPGYATQLGKVRTLMTKVANGTAPGMKNSETMRPVSSHSNAPQAPDGYEYVRRPDNKGWTAIKKVGG